MLGCKRTLSGKFKVAELSLPSEPFFKTADPIESQKNEKQRWALSPPKNEMNMKKK